MKKLIVVVPVIMLAMIVIAQKPANISATSAPIVASPSQQAEIKPLIEAEKKAAQEFADALAKLPEKIALDAAEAAYKAAAAKVPARATYDAAQSATLDKAYVIMAQNQLSAREYTPSMSEKGELVFIKTEKK